MVDLRQLSRQAGTDHMIVWPDMHDVVADKQAGTGLHTHQHQKQHDGPAADGIVPHVLRGMTGEQCRYGGEHRTRAFDEVGKACVAGAEHTPEQTEKDQADGEVAEQVVRINPLEAGLCGSPGATQGQSQQPVKSPGGDVPHQALDRRLRLSFAVGSYRGRPYRNHPFRQRLAWLHPDR